MKLTTNGASGVPAGAPAGLVQVIVPLEVPAEAGELASASKAGVVTDSAAITATAPLCRICMRCVPSLTS